MRRFCGIFLWGALAAAVAANARGQADPAPPTPPAPAPPSPMDVVAPPGALRIVVPPGGDPVVIQQNGARIVIQGGGALIINGPAINGPGGVGLVPAQVVDADMPVVSSGFFNDKDMPGSLAPLVEALRSSSYTQREEATQALMRLPPGRLDDVVAALRQETDSEAVERLTQIASHLFLKPRTYLETRSSLLGTWYVSDSPAVLGFHFKLDPVRVKPGDESYTMTIMVGEIQPGFPIAQCLRDGDRIVAIAGKGFPIDLSEMAFPERISSLWPGSVVTLTILRSGELIELPVQLAGRPSILSPTAFIEQRSAALTQFVGKLKMERSAAQESAAAKSQAVAEPAPAK